MLLSGSGIACIGGRCRYLPRQFRLSNEIERRYIRRRENRLVAAAMNKYGEAPRILLNRRNHLEEHVRSA